jgi:hypothetical protein
VMDEGRPSVHGRGRTHHAASRQRTYALMTEAHAEQRHRGFLDGSPAETEIIGALRISGARRNHNSVELLLLELIPGNLVVLENEWRLLANFSKVMDEIISEGVVIIDDYQSHCCTMK